MGVTMKQRNPKARCGNCVYGSFSGGTCRKNAPNTTAHIAAVHIAAAQVFGMTEKAEYNLWPIVKQDDWCGEHPKFFLPEHTDDSDTRMSVVK